MVLQPGSPSPVGDSVGQVGVSSAQYEGDDLLHPCGAWGERDKAVPSYVSIKTITK